MEIVEIIATPDQPTLGDTLQISVRIHNESQAKGMATINALFGRKEPNASPALQQARVKLEADESRDVLLFRTVVSPHVRPGRYQVLVDIRESPGPPVSKEFDIQKSEGFVSDF